MNEKWLENLKNAIEKSGLQHEIVIWGASNKSDAIALEFSKWGFCVSGYIDRNHANIRKYKGYTVYGAEKLKTKKYFVYVALQANYIDVIEILSSYGYQEFTDYWYPMRLVDLDGTKNYQDPYGNQLITENCNFINVRLRNGGKIEIKSKKLDGTTKITSEGDSHVIIGENVSVGKEVEISSINGKVEIGDGCQFDSCILIRASSKGAVYIHDGCTAQRQCVLVASFNARLILGADCMLSYFVAMRAGNSHNMIDLDSFVHLDDNFDRDVILGKHVWVGMRATIMNGVTIGSGATVGANSFVCKKRFMANCCVAGNPARVLRERTAWLRDGVTMNKNIEDYDSFIFENEDDR